MMRTILISLALTTFAFLSLACGDTGGDDSLCCMEATEIATTGSYPEHLLVDRSGIYWAGSDDLERTDLEGGRVELVGVGRFADLAVSDESRIYFISYDSSSQASLWSVEKGGSGLSLVFQYDDSETLITELAVDDDQLYWMTDGGAVRSVDKTTTNTVPQGITEFTATDLAVGADSIYVTTFSSVRKFPKTQGSTVNLVDFESTELSVGDIAVDDENVYWTRWSLDGSGFVQKISMLGGAVVDLAAGQANVGALAIGSEYVYFVNSTGGSGRIRRVPKSGGTVQDVHAAGSPITAIQLDDRYVYWAEFGEPSRIMKRAKASID